VFCSDDVGEKYALTVAVMRVCGGEVAGVKEGTRGWGRCVVGGGVEAGAEFAAGVEAVLKLGIC
jgi:hypothetical protein